MDKIIPVRVPEPVAGEIDHLVSTNLFRSRNDGIREGIRMVLSRYRSAGGSRHVVARIVANHLMNTRRQSIIAVILFGSVASGQDTGNSDIDLLVVTAGKAGHDTEVQVTASIIELLRGVDELVSLHFMDVHALRDAIKAGHVFESNVVQHGLVLAGTLPEGCTARRKT